MTADVTALAALALAGAGAVGAMLRHLAGVALPTRRSLPWGVLLVNVVGSFVAGLGVAAIDDPVLRLAVVAGFCGGLTTFSTHAVDTVRLATGATGLVGAGLAGVGEAAGGATGLAGVGGAGAAAAAGRRPAVRWSLAAANVVLTLVLAVGAVLAGAATGGALLGR